MSMDDLARFTRPTRPLLRAAIPWALALAVGCGHDGATMGIRPSPCEVPPAVDVQLSVRVSEGIAATVSSGPARVVSAAPVTGFRGTIRCHATRDVCRVDLDPRRDTVLYTRASADAKLVPPGSLLCCTAMR